jgi:P27 family predicted phage terminase small subunit
MMAKRGRKPTPRKVDSAVEGAPVKPGFIAEDPCADAEWDRVVELMADRNTLGASDSGVLASYCSAFSTIAQCRRELAGVPLTVTNVVSGVVKPHPLLGALSGAERSLVSFASELGLSPTSRARASAIESREEEDDLERILAD